MSKKNDTFAQKFDDDYEPTALAYTDFTKPMPILEGEDAERFLRNMEENERKAKEMANVPMSKEEAKRRLSCSKIILEFEKSRLEEVEKEIRELEDYINKG